ncbi:precorrin methylase [Rhodovulum imhoffii]|nr:cobalamin biosynthesis protein [Rhodovulum imhoffii]MBK5934466.1 precorrin methylase [Rhodovulum imhoffii]
MRVAGFGFRAAATAASLHDALEQAGGVAGLTALAAPVDKASAPCFMAFARALALPVVRVSQGALAAQSTCTQAPRVQRARGTGSVAEAAALAGAGPGARLKMPRQISTDRMAACAIATGDRT